MILSSVRLEVAGLIVIALVAYFCQAALLAMRIREQRNALLWPARWWVIASLPGVGWYIYLQAKKAGNKRFAIDSSRSELTGNIQEYRTSSWILFQEQYERKTGIYRGSRFHLLTRPEYRIVSHTSPQDVAAEETSAAGYEIEIPYPGKAAADDGEPHVWATLTLRDGRWELQNEQRYSIIATYSTTEEDTLRDDSIQLCKYSDLSPVPLGNGQRFIVHTTEFEIFRLPSIGVYMMGTAGELSFLGQISDVRISIDEHGLTSSDNGVDRHISFCGNEIRTQETLEYSSIFLPKRILTKGVYVLPLVAGDLIRCIDCGLTLLVDYAPDIRRGG